MYEVGVQRQSIYLQCQLSCQCVVKYVVICSALHYQQFALSLRINAQKVQLCLRHVTSKDIWEFEFLFIAQTPYVCYSLALPGRLAPSRQKSCEVKFVTLSVLEIC